MAASLKDPSPTIRILAAQILATLSAGHSAALKTLIKELYHRQPYVALRAANALDHLGAGARNVTPEIKLFLKHHSEVRNRSRADGAQYPEWILRRTIKKLESAQ